MEQHHLENSTTQQSGPSCPENVEEELFWGSLSSTPKLNNEGFLMNNSDASATNCIKSTVSRTALATPRIEVLGIVKDFLWKLSEAAYLVHCELTTSDAHAGNQDSIRSETAGVDILEYVGKSLQSEVLGQLKKVNPRPEVSVVQCCVSLVMVGTKRRGISSREVSSDAEALVSSIVGPVIQSSGQDEKFEVSGPLAAFMAIQLEFTFELEKALRAGTFIVGDVFFPNALLKVDRARETVCTALECFDEDLGGTFETLDAMRSAQRDIFGVIERLEEPPEFSEGHSQKAF